MIAEYGPSVGDHYGRPIPGWIKTNDGTRYDYNRIAVADADGGFWLAELASDECVIAPGLIYRRAAVASALQPSDSK